jgi:hypothetical protein
MARFTFFISFSLLALTACGPTYEHGWGGDGGESSSASVDGTWKIYKYLSPDGRVTLSNDQDEIELIVDAPDISTKKMSSKTVNVLRFYSFHNSEAKIVDIDKKAKDRTTQSYGYSISGNALKLSNIVPSSGETKITAMKVVVTDSERMSLVGEDRSRYYLKRADLVSMDTELKSVHRDFSFNYNVDNTMTDGTKTTATQTYKADNEEITNTPKATCIQFVHEDIKKNYLLVEYRDAKGNPILSATFPEYNVGTSPRTTVQMSDTSWQSSGKVTLIDPAMVSSGVDTLSGEWKVGNTNSSCSITLEQSLADGFTATFECKGLDATLKSKSVAAADVTAKLNCALDVQLNTVP